MILEKNVWHLAIAITIYIASYACGIALYIYDYEMKSIWEN